MEDEVVSNWIHDLLDDTTGGIDPDENILCCGWRSCGKCVLYKDLQLHIGMDHLSFEHYDTLVCFWDGCSSDKIFGSMQELREHIMLCHGNSQDIKTEPFQDNQLADSVAYQQLTELDVDVYGNYVQVTLPSEGNSVLEPHLQKQTQLEQTIDSELINILDCDLDSAIDLLPVADELQEDQPNKADTKKKRKSTGTANTPACKWGGCTGATFDTAEDLGNHLLEHIKSQRDIRRGDCFCEWEGCTRAGKTLKSTYNLVHHLRYKHTGEKPYQCSKPDCKSRFVQLSDLKEHLRNIHKVEDGYGRKKRTASTLYPTLPPDWQTPSYAGRNSRMYHYPNALLSTTTNGTNQQDNWALPPVTTYLNTNPNPESSFEMLQYQFLYPQNQEQFKKTVRQGDM